MMPMTISVVELHLLAKSMGVLLRSHNGGCPGWYDHHRRVISTRRGQSISQYKSVLAHELGHAGHRGTQPIAVTTTSARNDAPTNTPPDYSSIRMISKPPPYGTTATSPIADELEVTQQLLRVWETN